MSEGECEITQEEFDSILGTLVDENPASDLFSVPGVYEALKEHYNHVIIGIFKDRKEEAEE